MSIELPSPESSAPTAAAARSAATAGPITGAAAADKAKPVAPAPTAAAPAGGGDSGRPGSYRLATGAVTLLKPSPGAQQQLLQQHHPARRARSLLMPMPDAPQPLPAPTHAAAQRRHSHFILQPQAALSGSVSDRESPLRSPDPHSYHSFSAEAAEAGMQVLRAALLPVLNPKGFNGSSGHGSGTSTSPASSSPVWLPSRSDAPGAAAAALPAAPQPLAMRAGPGAGAAARSNAGASPSRLRLIDAAMPPRVVPRAPAQQPMGQVQPESLASLAMAPLRSRSYTHSAASSTQPAGMGSPHGASGDTSGAEHHHNHLPRIAQQGQGAEGASSGTPPRFVLPSGVAGLPPAVAAHGTPQAAAGANGGEPAAASGSGGACTTLPACSGSSNSSVSTSINNAEKLTREHSAQIRRLRAHSTRFCGGRGPATAVHDRGASETSLEQMIGRERYQQLAAAMAAAAGDGGGCSSTSVSAGAEGSDGAAAQAQAQVAVQGSMGSFAVQALAAGHMPDDPVFRAAQDLAKAQDELAFLNDPQWRANNLGIDKSYMERPMLLATGWKL